MKKKLFFTSFLISIIGVMSFFFVFVRQFMDKSFSAMSLMLVIVLACGATAAANCFLEKKWIYYVAVFSCLLIYMLVFRYEIIGGYMEFYNLIMDGYSRYFKVALYYATPKKKWGENANTVIMMYHTFIVISIFYTTLICKKKLLVIPFILNLLVFAIPTVIDKTPTIIYIVLNIAFLLQVLIMSAVAANGSNTPKAIFTMQLVSLAISFFMIIVCALASLVVPEKGYTKSTYFDKVGEYVVNVYQKIESKFSGIGTKPGSKPSGSPITGSGQSLIESGKLGDVGEIKYTNEELIKVVLPQNVGATYIKNFIGQSYENSEWHEVSADIYEPTRNKLKKSGAYSQEMTSELLKKYYNHRMYDINKYWMSVDFTGLIRTRQLMPLYPYTESPALFEGDGYYSEISDRTKFEYFNVSNENIVKLVEGNRTENLVENIYRDYVYDNYLTTHELCDSQFKKILENFKKDTPEDIIKIATYVREFLDNRCNYTLAPGVLPEGKDFINYFFNESQEGYCTYYASTAVMMLRSKGIPARYVAGFVVDPKRDVIGHEVVDKVNYNKVSVKDSSAHAWIEFYIDNFGWMQFEVTPGNFVNTGIVPPEQETTEEATTEKETTSENVTTTGEKHTTAPHNETTSQVVPSVKKHLSKTAVKNIILIISIFVISVGVVAIIFYRHRSYIINYELDYKDKKTMDLKACVRLNYDKFEGIMKFVKKPRPTEMSYEQYAEYLKKNCQYVWASDLHQLMKIYEKALFSENDILTDELEFTEHLVEELALRVYTEIGFFKKLSYRYIYNFIN